MKRAAAVKEKEFQEKNIVRYYEESIKLSAGGGSKAETIELSIPKDLDRGMLGQQFIEHVQAYMVCRANEYFAILPFIERTANDYDPSRLQGAFHLDCRARHLHASSGAALAWLP